MTELLHQFQSNAALSIIMLFTAAVFLLSLAWSAIAITRMLQICIATNLSLARELNAMQQSLVRDVVNHPIPIQNPTTSAMPSSAPKTADKKKDYGEGEFYAYDEADMADRETIHRLRHETTTQQGVLTNEELQSQIDSLKNNGFDEDEP
jgi:hypothetical protein